MVMEVMDLVVMEMVAQEMEVMAMAVMVAHRDLGQGINIQILETTKLMLISLHRLLKSLQEE